MGFDTSDDACVYRLRDDLAVIQTVDFFPPIVDDPYRYGQIAAANALSDIYAMGAEPAIALNILCVPGCLPQSSLQQIMAGGYDKVHEAGAVIAGGHSVEDAEPKYGLCVSAFIHPDKIWSNASAEPGDLLILTKPLGSGILATAAKSDLITAEDFLPALESMAMLNKYARDAAADAGVHACTDITGFGFLGHACEMADASGCSFELVAKDIPLYPHTQKLAEEGIIPAGAYRNREYAGKRVQFCKTVPLSIEDILFDPQTSGGLLFSIAQKRAGSLIEALEKANVQAALIGQVTKRSDTAVRIR